MEDGLRLSEKRGAQGLVDLALDKGELFRDLINERWAVEGMHLPTMESLGRLAKTVHS